MQKNTSDWQEVAKNLTLKSDYSDVVLSSIYQKIKNIAIENKRQILRMNPVEKVQKIAHWLNKQTKERKNRTSTPFQPKFSKNEISYLKNTYFSEDNMETPTNQKIKELLEKVFLQKCFKTLYITKK